MQPTSCKSGNDGRWTVVNKGKHLKQTHICTKKYAKLYLIFGFSSNLHTQSISTRAFIFYQRFSESLLTAVKPLWLLNFLKSFFSLSNFSDISLHFILLCLHFLWQKILFQLKEYSEEILPCRVIQTAYQFIEGLHVHLYNGHGDLLYHSVCKKKKCFMLSE